jgi:hypothetical protein
MRYLSLHNSPEIPGTLPPEKRDAFSFCKVSQFFGFPGSVPNFLDSRFTIHSRVYGSRQDPMKADASGNKGETLRNLHELMVNRAAYCPSPIAFFNFSPFTIHASRSTVFFRSLCLVPIASCPFACFHGDILSVQPLRSAHRNDKECVHSSLHNHLTTQPLDDLTLLLSDKMRKAKEA